MTLATEAITAVVRGEESKKEVVEKYLYAQMSMDSAVGG